MRSETRFEHEVPEYIGAYPPAAHAEWIAFAEEQALQIVYNDGEMSRIDLASFDVPDTLQLWVVDNWIVVYDWQFHQQFLAVHVVTHEVLLPPISPAELLTASPDGLWWIYAYAQEPEGGSDPLIAFNIETRETVTLASPNDLNHRDNFFDFWIWSEGE